MSEKPLHFLKKIVSAPLRLLGINLNERLLVSVEEEQGGSAMKARFVLLGSNDAVLSIGQCGLKELPLAVDMRATFFSAISIFEQIELESRKARTLPFLVRRHVANSLFFKDAFRVRFHKEKSGSQQYLLDVVATDEAALKDVSKALSLQEEPFTRLILVETAIASLVKRVTSEPAQVFWMRNGVLLALLVADGQVVARFMDNVDPQLNDADLALLLMRLGETVGEVADRIFNEQEVILALELGALAGREILTGKSSVPSRQVEKRFSTLFPDAEEGVVLQSPELFGLAKVPSGYSLLDEKYQVEATVS
ncbi:MAG: hypothetical protein R8K20_05205, partial [Gallionellaceae bacterium]